MFRSAITLLALIALNPAFAATIDFETIDSYTPAPVGAAGASEIQAAGFVFSASGYMDRFVRDGNGYLQTDAVHDAYPIVMQSISGETFALEQVAALVGGWDITGHYAGGGTVETSISVGGNAGTTVKTPLILGSEWQGLESVTFEANFEFFYSGLDDIVVSTVPIPAAAWLFGSALAGLGWLRRKKTA